MNEELQARTSDVPYYSKIDYRFLDRMAVVLTNGSGLYDPHVLVENWRLGDTKFFYKRANNGIRHIFKWLAGDRSEDHLAHAACNLMMLMWGEEQNIYNPASPEVRLLQYVNFVRSNQEKRAQVDPQPDLSTKETPTTFNQKTTLSDQTAINYSGITVTDITPSEEILTIATLVGNGKLPEGSGLDPKTGRVTILGEPEEIDVDMINDANISHVDTTGKPVIDIQKLKKKLLG